MNKSFNMDSDLQDWIGDIDELKENPEKYVVVPQIK